jgi:hypothetical protein
MRNRSSRHRSQPLAGLRLAIDCMPVATRRAMLAGARSERIIAGAYVDDQGGICPMLAAHRRGGRTELASFARAWDGFTGARRRAQRATRRELAILVAELEDSLASSDGLELDRAIAEHRALRVARLRRLRSFLEGMDPRGEILARRGRVRAPRPLLEGLAGPHEHDLGHHAGGRELEQAAHHL